MRASDPGSSADGALILEAPRRRRVAAVVRLPVVPLWVWILSLVLLGASVLAIHGTGFRYRPLGAVLAALPAPAPPPAVRGRAADLAADNKRLRAALTKRVPRGTYLVIDQASNRLYLKQGQDVLLEAVCSAGSGMVLREGSNGRSWIFDTPRGQFKVLQRIEDPVWRKPDWAFIEEGKPVPKDPGERLEYGMLGEYALYFGDGYMVHGTLYERMLGRSVTHGCIRLGRDNLRRVFSATKIGTPIFIY